MIPILSGNVASALGGGYEVANSLRFDTASSTDLVYTPSSTGSRRTFTWSVWIKRSKLGASQQIFTKKEGSGSDNNGNGNADYLALTYFNSDDTLTVARNQEGDYINVSIANRKFRDIGAWYHVVASIDTTQGTGSNRVKCWVNGEAQTLTFTTTPTENRDLDFNQSGEAHHLGSYGDGSSSYFSGYLAECVLMDGTAVSDATNFGEYDSDSPTIWKPKDVSGLSLGTNGFYLDFENSSSLGNDAAGSNNFGTVNNLAAIDQTTDTPTNSFATLNPLQTNAFDPGSTTFSEGNTKYVNGGSASYNSMWLPTIGVTSGKWYGEFKLGSHSTSSGHSIGIYRTKSEPYLTGGDVPASDMVRIIFADTSNIVSSFGSTAQSSLGSCSSGDIFGLYFDADDGKLHCYKNGSAYITQLTGITIAGYTWYMHTQGEVQSSRSLTFEHNYGNPSFSISSSNADPNGYGSFEYSTTENSVGYYALCTKNLAEFG